MGFRIIKPSKVPDVEVNLGVIGYALLALWFWAHRDSFIPDSFWEWFSALNQSIKDGF